MFTEYYNSFLVHSDNRQNIKSTIDFIHDVVINNNLDYK